LQLAAPAIDKMIDASAETWILIRLLASHLPLITARDREAADGSNWLVGGRTFDEQHFSPLKQVNDQNVGKLGLAWATDIESAMGLATEPIVVDGVIYVSAPQSRVYAVDALSGKVQWRFDPKVRLDRLRNW
jgi:quinohemoprotein ethanol dehydrogenase